MVPPATSRWWKGWRMRDDWGMRTPPSLSLVALVLAIAITIGILAAALTIPPV